MQRRQFSRKFKVEAVNLVRERGVKVTQAVRDLDLHAVTDANGFPFSFLMTAGQVRDYTGAAVLLDGLPKAEWLLGDRGYDADRISDALQEKSITPCITGGDHKSRA